MKKVLVLAIALTVLSCSNKEDCTAERTQIINKYEKLVEDVRNKEYWDEETVLRLYKDMNSALDRLRCD